MRTWDRHHAPPPSLHPDRPPRDDPPQRSQTRYADSARYEARRTPPPTTLPPEPSHSDWHSASHSVHAGGEVYGGRERQRDDARASHAYEGASSSTKSFGHGSDGVHGGPDIYNYDDDSVHAGHNSGRDSGGHGASDGNYHRAEYGGANAATALDDGARRELPEVQKWLPGDDLPSLRGFWIWKTVKALPPGRE